jgi:hypothetical protein
MKGQEPQFLTAGAYSMTDLCLALATETYTVSYSPSTMKISIICTTAYSLTCTSTTTSIWYEFFDTDANTGSATSHTTDNVLHLDFPSYVLISINEISSAKATMTANFRANFVVYIIFC